MVECMERTELLNRIKPTHDIKVFSGRANMELAEDIAAHLGTSVGPMIVKNFADGEIYVKVQESVRGDDIFIVQPLCKPVNEHLMELLIIVDAFKRASAKSITTVIPYYGYARQDRKASGREAISAKLVADLLTTAGVNRVLAMDLHTGQIQGYFNILVDHLTSMPIFVDYIRNKNIPKEELVLVSPDAGGVERTRRFAKHLNAPIAFIDKRRERHNEAKVEYVIGDVKDKIVVLFDDIIDTAGTISEGANLLKKNGAKEIYICAAHPVFSGPALERLADCEAKEIIVTNSIPLDKENLPKKITQLSIAELLSKAITRIHDDESVSSLFD